MIRISEMVTVGELAKAMGVKAGEVMKKLMDMGDDGDHQPDARPRHGDARSRAEFEYSVENVAFDVEPALEVGHEPESAEERPQPAAGGHDHGPRRPREDVAARRDPRDQRDRGRGRRHHPAHRRLQRGRRHGRQVTFLDTPGHEAFTAMRARGAKVTDIVVLVVAADDGVMPQTVEAINHAKAANVPIIVAVNKIDKPDANLDRVKQELADHGLAARGLGRRHDHRARVGEDAGRASTQLLEMILLQADVLELKANPDQAGARRRSSRRKLDRGRGPVATVLVQEGTLHAGDPFVCGTQYGRVRAMMDEKGSKLEEAGPSTPVEILGLGGVPGGGRRLQRGRRRGDGAPGRRARGSTSSAGADARRPAKVSLEELYRQDQEPAKPRSCASFSRPTCRAR